ncbi:MAG TPA: hypothetical protein VEA60_05090, partial [Allosphingosinicella sp.]|nr:hypothetical protein [Allosphingosinicella sp.]
EAALLPPVTALRIIVDGADSTATLAHKRPVPLLAGLGRAGRIEVEASLAAPFEAGHAGLTLALALVLEENGVAPEWAAAAVAVPPPSRFTLRWRTGGDGGEIAGFDDGTGGLRRSGLIRFPVPAALAGHDSLLLTLATDRVGHAEPPRLAAVHLGAAVAHHRWRRNVGPESADPGDPLWKALKAGIDQWLPISGQTLALPPELAPALEEDLDLALFDGDGLETEWTRVASLASLSPEDRGFTLDRELGLLAFGDGYNGRVPAAADIRLTLDLGGGVAGNHAAGLEWRRLADDPDDLRLRSAVDAVDGAEPESLADARARVGASLAERHRAVTAADYADLVEAAPGMSAHRAHVVPGHDPNFPCRYVSDAVSVFVVPRTGLAVPAPRADDGALAAIRTLLDGARLLTTRVFVLRPAFRPVSLEIGLRAGTGDAQSFADRLRPILAAYLHPAEGGPDGTGWPFGRALRPSELVRVAQEAVTADVEVERVSIRLEDEEGDAEACTDAAIGANDLVFLSRLRVRVAAPLSSGATL